MVDYTKYAIDIAGSSLEEREKLFKCIARTCSYTVSPTSLLHLHVYDSDWYAVPLSSSKCFYSSGVDDTLPVLSIYDIIKPRVVTW